MIKFRLEIEDDDNIFEGSIDYGITWEDIETHGYHKMLDKMTIEMKWQIIDAIKDISPKLIKELRND